MEYLVYFGYLYLGVGFLYATYILLFAGDPWYGFFVNMIAFPVYFVGILFRAFFRKKLPSFKDLFEGKRAVVFDLDGTLIESKDTWHSAIKEVARKEDLFVSDSVWKETGLGLEEKWEQIVKENDVGKLVEIGDLVKKTERMFFEILPRDFSVKDGFWVLYGDLKNKGNIKIVLATNSNRDVTDKIIKRLDLDGAFDFVITGDAVKNKKPNPEIYKMVSKELKIKPRNILVFEDSIAGSKASVKANMDTIVIWDRAKTRDWYPKKVKLYIPDFTPLNGNLDKTYHDMLERSAKMVEEGLVEI